MKHNKVVALLAIILFFSSVGETIAGQDELFNEGANVYNKIYVLKIETMQDQSAMNLAYLTYFKGYIEGFITFYAMRQKTVQEKDWASDEATIPVPTPASHEILQSTAVYIERNISALNNSPWYLILNALGDSHPDFSKKINDVIFTK